MQSWIYFSGLVVANIDRLWLAVHDLLVWDTFKLCCLSVCSGWRYQLVDWQFLAKPWPISGCSVGRITLWQGFEGERCWNGVCAAWGRSWLIGSTLVWIITGLLSLIQLLFFNEWCNYIGETLDWGCLFNVANEQLYTVHNLTGLPLTVSWKTMAY